jgi:hypothetical protein
MVITSGVTIGTDSTQVIDIPGSSRQPAVRATHFAQQRNDENQRDNDKQRWAYDDDDPLAIMW